MTTKREGIFGKDLAEVKLLSFVTTDNIELPDMSDFINENDLVKKKDFLKPAIENIIANRNLTTIQNITDNHVMYFGDTGYILYQSKEIPDNFSWQFIAVESDQATRDTTHLVKYIESNKDFDSFTVNLATILSAATNPAFTATVATGKYTTQVFADIVKQKKDDLIGMTYMSLDRRQHYQRGERKKDDVTDLTGNMFFDCSVFGYEE